MCNVAGGWLAFVAFHLVVDSECVCVWERTEECSLLSTSEMGEEHASRHGSAVSLHSNAPSHQGQALTSGLVV